MPVQPGLPHGALIRDAALDHERWIRARMAWKQLRFLPVAPRIYSRIQSSCCSARDASKAGSPSALSIVHEIASLLSARIDASAAAGTPARELACSEREEKKSLGRLDDACCAKYPAYTKAAIQSWIVQGKVTVNDKVVVKAGYPVKPSAAIFLRAKQDKFVCRAGHKLEAALEHFGIDTRGKRILDSGISTGGFTDCLLQRGAGAVIGVDVGYGQVAERVRTDERVTILERTNIRHLKLSELPGQQPVHMVTLDLSFISVLKVLPGLRDLMTPDATLVVLIKPQFEALRHQIEEGGVVRDPGVHKEVIHRLRDGIESLGFAFQGCIQSPIAGAASGNKEFLAYFIRCGGKDSSA